MKSTRDYALSGKFKRVIIVNGRWHVDKMTNHPFKEFVSDFFESFGQQRIVAFFTPTDLEEQEAVDFEGKERIDALFDRLTKNREK